MAQGASAQGDSDLLGTQQQRTEMRPPDSQAKCLGLGGGRCAGGEHLWRAAARCHLKHRRHPHPAAALWAAGCGC